MTRNRKHACCGKATDPLTGFEVACGFAVKAGGQGLGTGRQAGSQGAARGNRDPASCLPELSQSAEDATPAPPRWLPGLPTTGSLATAPVTAATATHGHWTWHLLPLPCQQDALPGS